MRIRLRTILLCAVALGVVLRILAAFQGEPDFDSSHDVAMANTFASGNEFLLPYGSFYQTRADPNGLTWIFEPVPSQHFAPMWPVLLATGYGIVGFSLAATMASSLIVSVLAISIAFLITRDLMGSEKAWVVAAAVSLDFLLIQMTAVARSENLLVITYMATIWAILRGLKDDRYMVLAGLLAGVSYLTKSSVGYLFLLAGSLGFLWRFYYMRSGVFRNRYYLAAIALFLTVVGAWGLRNILAFGWPHWETSPYANAALAYAVARPLEFFPLMGVKAVLYLLYCATVAFFFAPQIIRATRHWKDEDANAHLLAIGLPILFGIIFAAAFAIVEPWEPLWWEDNLRYVNIAIVPMLWFALRRERLPLEWQPRLGRPVVPQLLRSLWKSLPVRIPLLLAAAFAFFAIDHMVGIVLAIGALILPKSPEIKPAAVVCFVLALGLASVNSATSIHRSAEYNAGRFLAELTEDGDVVALAGSVNPYFLYPYLADRHVRFVQWNASESDFLLSTEPGNYSGYGLIAVFNGTRSPGFVDSAYNHLATAALKTLGLPYRQGSPYAGDLFVYRPRL